MSTVSIEAANNEETYKADLHTFDEDIAGKINPPAQRKRQDSQNNIEKKVHTVLSQKSSNHLQCSQENFVRIGTDYQESKKILEAMYLEELANAGCEQ